MRRRLAGRAVLRAAGGRGPRGRVARAVRRLRLGTQKRLCDTTTPTNSWKWRETSPGSSSSRPTPTPGSCGRGVIFWYILPEKLGQWLLLFLSIRWRRGRKEKNSKRGCWMLATCQILVLSCPNHTTIPPSKEGNHRMSTTRLEANGQKKGTPNVPQNARILARENAHATAPANVSLRRYLWTSIRSKTDTFGG